MEPFSVNNVFSDRQTGLCYRILWIAPDSSSLYTIPTTGNSGMPSMVHAADLSARFADGWCEPAGDPFAPPDNPSDEDIARRDKTWALLRDMLLDEPAIYERKKRASLMKAASERTGMDRHNMYRLLRLYWQRGKTPDAFLANRKNQGGRGRKRPCAAPGARRAENADYGKKLEPADYAYFEDAIRKYYLTKKQPTMSSTYERLIEDHYSTTDGDGKTHMLPPGQVPSLRQLRYWYHSNHTVKEEIQKREGNNAFELTGRGVTGRADTGLMGPGSQFQVDATIGDIYLVSQFDRRDIIGRPVIYFVMDTFSRIVTGMYVGLEGPSWAGMMEALYNSSTDKVDYCHKYGIEISESEWPCRHMPSVLLGDRGELESRNADGLVNSLGIRVDNAPPYRGDLKPIIERNFKTMDGYTKPFLPGAVMPDMARRGGHDYRLDAKLDLRQFTAIIINCVIFYNNYHYLPAFEKSGQMMKSGVNAVPVDLWNWGIRNQSGALRTFPEETVRLALLPRSNASVTEKGIRFKGIFYSCQEARDSLWFEKARKEGRYSVSVSYDPRDLSRIYVRNAPAGSYLLCDLLDWQQKYEGKSLDEVEFEEEKRKAEEKKNERREMEAKIDLNRAIDSIVEDAEQMKPSTDGTTKSERISGIGPNRAHEKEAMRAEESFVSGKIGRTPSPATETGGGTKTDEPMSPILKKIKKSIEERNRNGS